MSDTKNNVQLTIWQTGTCEQYDSVSKLLNVLRLFTVHSAHNLSRKYDQEYERDFYRLDCCGEVKENCYCDADDYPYYDDYYDDFSVEAEKEPSEKEKV